jgi:uncharacterized membrane protein
MNKEVRKAFFKSIGLNILAGLILLAPLLFIKNDNSIGWLLILIFLAVLSLFIQLIISVLYINTSDKKEVGQGMLLSVGVFLLIGVAVCGPMWF